MKKFRLLSLSSLLAWSEFLSRRPLAEKVWISLNYYSDFICNSILFTFSGMEIIEFAKLRTLGILVQLDVVIVV